MSIYRQEVVDTLKSWKHMKEVDGSYKPIVDIYNSIQPLPCGYRLKYTDDWGPSTLSAAYKQAGFDAIFPCECNYSRMINRAKEMDIWEEYDGYWPKIADVCMIDKEADEYVDNIGIPDYAGIVISTDKESRSFVIMIGNVDRAIDQRTLSVNSKFIRGFIVPKFPEETVTKPVPPTETIVTPTPPDDSTIKEPEIVGSGTLSKIAAGTAVMLQNTPIYASPKTKSISGSKTGRYYIWSVDTINGRVRITNAKSNVGVKGQVTGWVNVANALNSAAEPPVSSAGPSTPQYQVDAVYVVQFDDLQIRKGPGTNYPAATYYDLTPNAKKYDKQKKGCLCAGAKVTCQDVKVTGVNVWMKIPSGWVPAYYNRRYNVK